MGEDVHPLASWDRRFEQNLLTDQVRSGALAVHGLLPSEAGSATPWIGPFDGPVRRSYLDQPITYLHEPVYSLTPLGQLVRESHRKRLRIERLTARWHLSFRSARSKAVNEQRFPDVVQRYRQHFDQREFPSQPDEFLRSLTAAVLRTRPDLPAEDVRARATMFLAGLVRQHHFALLLQEHFDLVIWDDRLDREYGLDLVLVHESMAYGLALSMSGYRSRAWQERKQYRHPTPDVLPICRIEAPLQDFRPGQLWLHGDGDLRRVSTFIASSKLHRRRGTRPLLADAR